MELLIIIFIYILGTIFGSFSSVVISRIRKKEKGIFMGRSHCTSCNTTLQARDLIPIFSYVFSRGKCRFCNQKVSALYPILEIVMGTVFALGAYFFVDLNYLIMGNSIEFFRLFFVLYISFFSIVYMFYDILYLEIPETVMKLLIFPTFGILALQTVFNTKLLPFFDNINLVQSTQVISIIISFLILIGLYMVMTMPLKNDKLDTLKDFGIIIFSYILLFILHSFGFDLSNIPILNGILASLIIFAFFFLQYYFSNGKAIGGGDFLIGIFMGLLLGLNYGFFGIICSYLFGSIVGLGVVFRQYLRQLNSDKDLINTIIPFGPFLAMGMFFVIYFHKYLGDIFGELMFF
ncbi:MAG: prepilin peptidase [Candidatus Gracilibacteria bacterium]|nr:prepilin peptidase [Candidatus Gracilibacteria bacterium]